MGDEIKLILKNYLILIFESDNEYINVGKNIWWPEAGGSVE